MPDVEVVAEIGINYNGDADKAFALVDAAKAAGADCVKFQASIPSEEMSRRYVDGDFEIINRFILPHDELERVVAHAKHIGLPWLCTPAESLSLEWMMGVGCDRIKISSDNLTNMPFLRAVAQCGKPVILATGMATMEEISLAIYLLMGYLPPALITVLHCTSAYPCPVNEANLNAITTLRRVLPDLMQVGWSDHTGSLTLPSVAVGLGAVMIEKHLTLDKSSEGPDHAASIEPREFAVMVKLIREAQAALGDGIKQPMPSEAKCMATSRKSIMAACAIAEGERFTFDNLSVKRPGTGRSPLGYFDLIEQIATRSYERDEMIA